MSKLTMLKPKKVNKRLMWEATIESALRALDLRLETVAKAIERVDARTGGEKPYGAPAKPRPVFAVDIDGVLCKNDWRGPRYFGPVLDGARPFMNDLNRFADVVIHTSRCWSDEVTEYLPQEELIRIVKEWLDANGFKYAGIVPKPRCSAYIDDRALSCLPQIETGAYVRTLIFARELTKGT